jgi:hypothetical protein
VNEQSLSTCHARAIVDTSRTKIYTHLPISTPERSNPLYVIRDVRDSKGVSSRDVANLLVS